MSAFPLDLFEVRLRNPLSQRAKTKRQFIPARNPQDALHALSADQKQRLISVTRMSTADQKVAYFFDFPSWYGLATEKMAMLANFALLLGVGLPILDAIYLQVRNTPSLKAKAALMGAAYTIRTNGNIAKAFTGYPELFNASDLAMITAGEETGQLDLVFRQLYAGHRKASGAMVKIRNSLIYPGIIMFLTYALTVLFCFVFIPKLKDVYEQLNARLPWITQQLVKVSDLLIEHNWVALLPLVGVGILYKLMSNLRVKIVAYRIAMLLPIASTYINKIAMTNIMRSLSLTASAGIPLNEGITMAMQASDHPVYSGILRDIIGDINNGESPSSAFYQRAYAFGTEGDRIATTMEVGERTGDVSKPVEQLAAIYEEDLDSAASNLQKLIEPVSVLMVAVVVGFLVFAMYYPVFTLGANFMDPTSQQKLGINQ